MKKYLLIALLPFSVCAEDFYVQDELANMVDEVIRTTRLKVNIPDMAPKYVRIDQIDGLGVCAPEAKQKVLQLQTAFNKHPNMFRTKSILGAYHRQANGDVIYKPMNTTPNQNKCEFITVSVR